MNLHTAFPTWKNAFENALPVGFFLREQFSDRWIRIHSLANGKRYPTNPSEYSELLNRNNTVASYVLGENTACDLFSAQFGKNKNLSNKFLQKIVGKNLNHAFSSEDPDDPIQFFSAPVTWHRSSFDELICAIADEKINQVLFANTLTQRIYAPYDGGADLIFESSMAAQVAREKFHLWLSDREDGL